MHNSNYLYNTILYKNMTDKTKHKVPDGTTRDDSTNKQ